MTNEKKRTIGLISYRVGVVGLLALIASQLSNTMEVRVSGGYVNVDSVRVIGTVNVKTSGLDTVTVWQRR